MPGFQSAINATMGFGVPGELAYDGPHRAAPWQLQSAGVPNVVGATACTVVSDGVAMAGGTGVFCGVLADPKVYANFMGGLAPTMTLADNTIGELVTMGQITLFLTSAANIGDKLVFTNATGAISSIAPAATPGAGTTLIPNSKVVLRNTAANGLAICELTD